MIKCIFFWNVFGVLSYNDPELHLPVGFDWSTNQFDVIIRTRDGTGSFHEYNRFRRNWPTGFFRMIRVIKTDTDKFSDPADTWTEAGIILNTR